MKKYFPRKKIELKELIKDNNIYLGDIDTSKITSMARLFKNTRRTNFAGINEWDTSRVTNMNEMFSGCKYFNEKLEFDTTNVVNMNAMFKGCKSFNQALDFNTSNVYDMSYMFYECEKYNQAIKFDMANVVNTESMFNGCISFTQELRLNTKNTTNMNSMFEKTKIKSLEINASSLRDCSFMLREIINLDMAKVKLKNFSIDRLYECYELSSSYKNIDEFLNNHIKDYEELLRFKKYLKIRIIRHPNYEADIGEITSYHHRNFYQFYIDYTPEFDSLDYIKATILEPKKLKAFKFLDVLEFSLKRENVAKSSDEMKAWYKAELKERKRADEIKLIMEFDRAKYPNTQSHGSIWGAYESELDYDKFCVRLANTYAFKYKSDDEILATLKLIAKDCYMKLNGKFRAYIENDFYDIKITGFRAKISNKEFNIEL